MKRFRNVPWRAVAILFVALAARGDRGGGILAIAQEKQTEPMPKSKEPTPMEKEAKAVLEEFYAAWNAADNERLRKAMNFPFVSLFANGQITTAQTAADFTNNFDRMRQTERWHHSTLDKFEAISVAGDSVHCKVTFSRYHEDNGKYMTMTMLYIVTKKDGHWGMQFRTPMSGG